MSLRVLHLDPPEVICTEPIHCVLCGWAGDADEHSGQYKVIEGMPAGYPWAADGDVLCEDCTLACCECGEELLDGGCFTGSAFDGQLFCDYCLTCGMGGEY